MPRTRRRRRQLKRSRRLRKQRGGAAEENVLYLGMSADIMPVFYLVPDFTHLYSINWPDPTYGTIEETKECILKQLMTGRDDCPQFDSYRVNFNNPEFGEKIYRTLPDAEPATEVAVIQESDEEAQIPWKVRFIWKGKERFITYYMKRNFVTDEWPAEITDIGHVIWIGAYAWENLAEDGAEHPIHLRMYETRTVKPYIYGLDYEDFPNLYEIPTGYEPSYRPLQAIKRRRIESFNGEWWL